MYPNTTERKEKRYNHELRKDNRVHKNAAYSKPKATQKPKADDIGSFGDTNHKNKMGSDNLAHFEKIREKNLQKCLQVSEGLLDETDTAGDVDQCIICLNPVKHTQPIWKCPSCFCHLFHLYCIQKWIKDGVKETKPVVDDAFPLATKYWKCPNCNTHYEMSDRPTTYHCYCGKTENPIPDPWLPPHSCNQICNLPLTPPCGHKCTQPCHPGKCSPCGSMLMVDCYCGRVKQMRACSSRKFGCGGVCGKNLCCGVHQCGLACHEGECPPCLLVSLRDCRCGRVRLERPCQEKTFSCGTLCNLPHPCGHHRCQQECHQGPCGPCPGQQARYCYCGKKEIKRPCWEEVAESCLDGCDKVLNCGVHRCVDRCHKGPCPKCREFVVKRCHCGQKTKLVQCHLDYHCDIKCQVLLNCTKHRCGQKCCTGGCGPCPRLCDTPLQCGNHRCSTICHTGPCVQCPLSMEVTCPCGEIQKTVPCGKKFILPHFTPRTCPGNHLRRRVDCHVLWLDCSEICGNLLSCGNHTCTRTCHKVTIQRAVVHHEETKRDEVVVVRDDGSDDLCTPCLLPCLKKERPCKHPCREPCHFGHCQNCEVPISSQCYCNRVKLYLSCWQTYIPEQLARLRSCRNKCDRKLPDCNHLCDLPCHPGRCDTFCLKKVNVKCRCNRIKMVWSCDKVREEIKSRGLSTFQYNILPCDKTCEEEKKRRQQRAGKNPEISGENPEISDENPEISEKTNMALVSKKEQKKKKDPEEVTSDGGKKVENLLKRKKLRPWYKKPGFVVVVVGLVVVLVGFLVLEIL